MTLRILGTVWLFLKMLIFYNVLFTIFLCIGCIKNRLTLITCGTFGMFLLRNSYCSLLAQLYCCHSMDKSLKVFFVGNKLIGFERLDIGELDLIDCTSLSVKSKEPSLRLTCVMSSSVQD